MKRNDIPLKQEKQSNSSDDDEKLLLPKTEGDDSKLSTAPSRTIFDLLSSEIKPIIQNNAEAEEEKKETHTQKKITDRDTDELFKAKFASLGSYFLKTHENAKGKKPRQKKPSHHKKKNLNKPLDNSNIINNVPPPENLEAAPVDRALLSLANITEQQDLIQRPNTDNVLSDSMEETKKAVKFPVKEEKENAFLTYLGTLTTDIPDENKIKKETLLQGPLAIITQPITSLPLNIVSKKEVRVLSSREAGCCRF